MTSQLLGRARYALILMLATVGTACSVVLPADDQVQFACRSDHDCASDRPHTDRPAPERSDAFVDAAVTDVRAVADTAATDRVSIGDAARPDQAPIDDAARPDQALIGDVARPDQAPIDDAAHPDQTPIADTARPDLAGPADASRDGGPWWDDRWSRRRRLALDNSGRAEALDDFPVLVKLMPGRIDYAATRSNGDDVRFVDADSSTQLASEIEQWASNGTSWVWVKVPRIDAASAGDFMWMYYGNPAASAPGPGSAVWSNRFEAVYHLGAILFDSTGSGFDGSGYNLVAATGAIGLARSFDGYDSWIDIGHDRGLLQSTGAATLSAWVSLQDTYTNQNVVSVSVHDPSGLSTMVSRACMAVSYYEMLVAGRSTDSEAVANYATSGAGLAAGTWYQLTVVFDFSNDSIAFFKNGQPVGSVGAPFAQLQTPATTATNSAIGAQDNGSADFTNGVIDEVRVVRAARSAAWISAEYQNQALDSLVSFGPEQVY